MKQPLVNANSISPQVLAVLLGTLAVLTFGAAAMLLYCAVQPFGLSPPPPAVCWIVGTILLLLSVASAFGSYRYSRLPGRNAAASSIGSLSGSREASAVHDPVAQVPVASPAARKDVNGAFKAPDQPGMKFNMRDALLEQPALQQCMGSLIEGLIQAAPEHYSMIHLLVETRRANGKTSILFTYGSPVLLNEYSTLVPDSIANAAFRAMDLLLRQDDSVPGFEVVLRKTAATKWDADAHRLDEPDTHQPRFPRYPLRVCGYGFSLAPPPDTVFRWARNLNPPAIMAAARKSSNAPFKQVQITFAESGPRVLLRDGVGKAEEVIQLSEGPKTSQWVIETPAFHAIWPEGFDLRYPLASKTRFDLLGADDTIIFVQDPVSNEKLLDGMAAEGQTETGLGKTPSGHEWIELGYEVEGTQWRQRHYTRHVSRSMSFVITAQCLQSLAHKVFQSSGELADSLHETAKYAANSV
jgi:hypothetical protein